MKALRHIFLLTFATAFTLASCCKEEPSDPSGPQEITNAMILYQAGFNNLDSYLKADLNEMLASYVPEENEGRLLFFCNHPVNQAKANPYAFPTSPLLMRAYKRDGKVVTDTLYRYPLNSSLGDVEIYRQILTYLKDHYSSPRWGIVLSSHGTGYLPQGFYDSEYSFSSGGGEWEEFCRRKCAPVYGPHYRDENPEVKTIVSEWIYEGGVEVDKEIEIKNLAAATPMHLEYFLFDACFMGTVECAYELKDVCNYFGGSPCEIKSDGFDYKNITERLLRNDTPDPKAVIEDYVNSYKQRSYNRNACGVLVNCGALEDLSDICHTIFKAHKAEIDTLSAESLQRYYRKYYRPKGYFTPHWFYDLGSIMHNLKLSEEEKSKFEQIYGKCIAFSDCTESFMPDEGGFYLTDFSGLATYFPGDGCDSLSTFCKKDTKWWKKIFE